MKRYLLIVACLMAGQSALASPPAVPPCKDLGPNRTYWPNGTLLWGMERKDTGDETSSLLQWIALDHVRLPDGKERTLRLEKGHLVASALGPEQLVGAVFQGAASDGQHVEVALCRAESPPEEPTLVRYRIQVWNPEKETWTNPCLATNHVPNPLAFAVPGVWDQSGARQEKPGKFTFACENGAIAKCITWGYKPWDLRDGHSLEDLHQACTRMARADYCGNGHSHTQQDTPIDMYDGMGLLSRARVATANWDPGRASFEAAWSPEGAWCLARTRYGQELEGILKECPGRFEAKTKDLGDEDRCTMLRHDAGSQVALLRNRSYGHAEQVISQKPSRQ